MTENIIFRQDFRRKNLYLSDKPYFMIKERSEGEDDLVSLVEKEHNEGCWAFIPRFSEWYNLCTEVHEGINEKGEYELGVETYACDMSQFARELSHYHIHPKWVEEEQAAKSLKTLETFDQYNSLSDKAQEMLHGIMNREAAVLIALPSYIDIEAYQDIASESPGCTIDFKIVSPYGCLTLNLRELGHILPASELYSKVQIECEEAAAQATTSNEEAIAFAVEYVNELMKDFFTLEMDFFE